MDRARYRAIIRQEQVPSDGVWRAHLNHLWEHRPPEEGMPPDQYEAGLRVMLRCLKAKGLGSRTYPEITNEDIARVVAEDPRLGAAMQGVPGGQEG